MLLQAKFLREAFRIIFRYNYFLFANFDALKKAIMLYSLGPLTPGRLSGFAAAAADTDCDIAV